MYMFGYPNSIATESIQQSYNYCTKPSFWKGIFRPSKHYNATALHRVLLQVPW